MKKIIFMVIGFVFLGLGALGAILPILPTVPFLLVSAYCFGRSSDKINNWFKQTNLYKNNLESFVAGQGMTKKAKIRVLTLISSLMLFGFIMMSAVPVGRIVLVFVWLMHIWIFMYKIKTKIED